MVLLSILKSIEFDVEYGAEQNPNFKDADGWTCTLYYDEREIEVPFYMGKGHLGAEPQKEDVLDALFMDAQSIDMNFVDWCAEFGYNDSNEALDTYNACKNISEKLEYLLGSSFDTVKAELQEYI